MSEKTYGILAEFDSPAAILSAAEKVRDAGYSAGMCSRHFRFTAWTR